MNLQSITKVSSWELEMFFRIYACSYYKVCISLTMSRLRQLFLWLSPVHQTANLHCFLHIFFAYCNDHDYNIQSEMRNYNNTILIEGHLQSLENSVELNLISKLWLLIFLLFSVFSFSLVYLKLAFCGVYQQT